MTRSFADIDRLHHIAASLDYGCAWGSLLVVIVLAFLLLQQKKSGSERVSDLLSGEGIAVSLLLLLALFLRIAGSNLPLTPLYTDALSNTVFLDEHIRGGRLLDHAMYLFTHFQGLSWETLSVTALPVAFLARSFVGPGVLAEMLCGAWWGILTCAAGWYWLRIELGLRTSLWGLVFFACAPLAVLWSRIGGMYEVGPAWVAVTLATLALAYHRRSFFWALAAAFAIWFSLYGHYASRVAWVPGMLYGLRFVIRDRRDWKYFAIIVVFPVTVGLLWCILKAQNIFWPDFGTYSNFLQALKNHDWGFFLFIAKNYLNSLNLYFFSYRDDSIPAAAGLLSSGATFWFVFPCALLGLFQLRTEKFLLLLFLLTSIAAVSAAGLSVAETRKLLVFDFLCCSLAAHGLSRIFHSFHAAPPLFSAAFFPALFALPLSLWSASMIICDSTSPKIGAPYRQFGSGYWSVLSDLMRPYQLLSEWKEFFTQGDIVISAAPSLFNSPLEIYGGIAALESAHDPDNFIHLPELLTGVHNSYRRVLTPYRSDGDVSAWLQEHVAKNNPPEIVISLEPLSELLKIFGEVVSPFAHRHDDFLSSRTGETGTRFFIKPDHYSDFLKFVHSLSLPHAQLQGPEEFEISELPRLNTREVRHPGDVVFYGPDEWFGHRFPELYSRSLTDWGIVGISTTKVQGELALTTLSDHGASSTFTKAGPSAKTQVCQDFFRCREVMPECIAFVHDEWIGLDPRDGELWPNRLLSGIRKDGWVGIAGEGDLLELTNAQGQIFEIDLRTHRVHPTEQAELWHGMLVSRRTCARVFRWNNWTVSFNALTTELVMRNEHETRSYQLDKLLGVTTLDVTGVFPFGDSLFIYLGTTSQGYQLHPRNAAQR